MIGELFGTKVSRISAKILKNNITNRFIMLKINDWRIKYESRYKRRKLPE